MRAKSTIRGFSPMAGVKQGKLFFETEHYKFAYKETGEEYGYKGRKAD